MKKYLFALLGFTIALAITNQSAAQKNTVLLMQNEFASLNIKGLSEVVNSPSEGVASINVRALKNFSKMFKNITTASWDKTVEGFRASFTLDNVKSFIYFDSKGRWVADLITYKEPKLSKNIRDMVKREYYDYNIYQVQEVTTLQSNGIPTFVIYLENANSLKTLVIYEDDIHVWQDLQKQH